ncbi:universal stress protein [Pseudonocardia bannensis]|uniref:Universal stress protein n=1 Tax=Pseudonocardia bannensis TaxID=630973 RepID=A0A848DF00_9PSEU|nr:universal stress protein [Pseudonocardia bannensis]NMH91200.1 universal stress protein [Pseudonocardia bannensis]
MVGADGSPGSEVAIGFALQEAARRGAQLIVVAAFDLPPYWACAYGMPAAPESSEALRETIRDHVEAHVRKVADSFGEQARDVPVEIRPVVGDPAAALVDAARHADLLVVGHRGGGGFANLLLGSVASKCVLHATCPVTIVPTPDRVAVG